MPEIFTVERTLHKHVLRFINIEFIQRLRARAAASNLLVFAADTSRAAGKDSGQWTRPDLAALVVGRGEYVPFWHAELHTFEIKTASGVDETAAHEANAHGRFGHYPWLVFQTTDDLVSEGNSLFRKLSNITSHLGVGLVHFADAEAPQSWTIEHWPRKTGTDNRTADNFVRERFSSESKKRIALHLAGLGWAESP